MAKIVNKEEKKAEILQAALRVIAEKGIAGTRIQAIADEAGMAKGTVYLYFRNKEEILQSILEQHVHSSNLSSKAMMSTAIQPVEKVRSFLNAMVAATGHHEKSPGLYLEILAALLRSSEGGAFESGFTDFRDLLAELLSDVGGDLKPEPLHQALASAMIALLHGLSMLSSISSKGFPVKETVELTTEFILSALEEGSNRS